MPEPKKKHRYIKNYRLVRVRLGLSQSAFWGRLGVTQSTGSRIESGSVKIAKPVAALAHMTYILGSGFDIKDYAK